MDGTAPTEATKHNESDLKFIGSRAGNKSVPAHTPEWTDPTTAHPGRKKASEKDGKKGGPADINIGVGESPASPGRDSDRGDANGGGAE